MTAEFPRTDVGGASMPRLIIGTNGFVGCCHQTQARDKLVRSWQTAEKIADTLCVFMDAGVDALIGMHTPLVWRAIDMAQQRIGRPMKLIVTPAFGFDEEGQAKRAIEDSWKAGARICLLHQSVTDALADRRARCIRDLDYYTAMIRAHGMIPGLSTHMPETIGYADAQGANVETYLQMYNAAGFLMQMEPEWVLSCIQAAAKPVIAIKPLAAGRLTPLVGLGFVWSTLRPCDMVAVGTTSPDEAREVIDISLAYLAGESPVIGLQATRSKASIR